MGRTQHRDTKRKWQTTVKERKACVLVCAIAATPPAPIDVPMCEHGTSLLGGCLRCMVDDFVRKGGTVLRYAPDNVQSDFVLGEPR